MSKTYDLTLVTPEEQLFSGEVYSLKAPAHEGKLGVLAGHAPMLCSLQPGVLEVSRPEQDDQFFSITGGFMEVTPQGVIILADAASIGEQIDVEDVRENYRDAYQNVYGSSGESGDTEDKKALERAKIRLEAARKSGKEGASVPEMLS